MIELKNISKSYGKNQILKNLDLSINESEFIVVLGPSGCGKTTLLRLISGLEQPTEGDIVFDGKSVLKLIPKERDISMVFQNYALFPDMNVYQNIAFGLQIRKIKKDDIFKKVNDISKKLKIENLLKRKPSELSGGEQQRVALARAMVKNPRLYLFDEPMSNLDVNLKDEFMDLIKEIHKETNATFIYVTHAQNEALKLADRIVIMNQGSILQIDEPTEIYKKPKDLFVANFIGEPKINILNLANSQYKIGFRPESITIINSNSSAEGLLFESNIDNIEFVGNGYIISTVLGNQKIKVFSLEKCESKRLKFFIPQSQILLFDSDGKYKEIENLKLLLKDDHLFMEEHNNEEN